MKPSRVLAVLVCAQPRGASDGRRTLPIAPLAAADQRFRLFPFALLAPPPTIALTHGQTRPFMLLALGVAARARWPALAWPRSRSRRSPADRECHE